MARRSRDYADAKLGKRDPNVENYGTPRKAFENEGEFSKNKYFKFTRQKSAAHPKNPRLVAPPPPPREHTWQREKKKAPLTLEQRLAEKKDSVLVRHIPACYNVVNHLTKYFQR